MDVRRRRAGDANRCKDADRFGWYATLVQNVGDTFALAVRFDQYDPTSSLSDDCAMMAAVTAADRDKQTNLGVALLAYISGNLKATLAYDHFGEQDGGQAATTTPSPCSCRRSSSGRRGVQAFFFNHEGDYRCVSTNLFVLAICSPRRRWRPRPRRSPSRARTPWSSSASAGPRST